MVKPTVSFYPDYRRSNPYQSLLYAALPSRRAVFEDLAAAHARLRRKGNGIFHLHWTAPLFKGIWTEETFYEHAKAYLEQLTAYQADGGRILWTIHNVLPHVRLFKEAEIWFRAQLAEVVDRIHVHDAAAIDQITKFFPLPEDKITVAAHGHMIGAYRARSLRNLLKPGLTRKRLGLFGAEPVAAVIGQLRANKGIEDFLTAVPDAPVQALLAGRVTPKKAFTDFTARCEKLGIAYRDGFIPSDQMTTVFGLADMIVLPYREVLTSGSLVLALSMGKPVILPDLPSFEPLKDKPFADFYRPGTPETMTAALSRMAAQSDRTALGQAAKDYVGTFRWEDTAQVLFADF